MTFHTNLTTGKYIFYICAIQANLRHSQKCYFLFLQGIPFAITLGVYCTYFCNGIMPQIYHFVFGIIEHCIEKVEVEEIEFMIL